MGSSIEDGLITVGDYCCLMLVFFQSWLLLLQYQSRFHQDDLLTNIMCAARPSPPPTRAHCHLTPSLFR